MKGFDGVRLVLSRPRLGLVLVAALAACLGSFLIGWTHSWTPTLMFAMPACVLCAAFLIPKGSFQKPIEYMTALFITAIALCFVIWHGAEPALNAAGILDLDDFAYIAIGGATVILLTLLYAFFVGVRSTSNSASSA